MCGIAGVIGRRDEPLVEAMLARLGHRGPDDRHHESGSACTLGATRLSILDLDGGRQPMRSESGRVIACQNGEIYDYLELREELERLGHRFRSTGDTEVLVHGTEAWGRELPAHLVGMFAVAAWDEALGGGLLARDRVGKKPLYYHVAPDGSVIFASEIKSLLEVPSVGRDLDPAALDLYLSLKHVPGPRTIWKDVRELPPGHALHYDAARRSHEIRPYHRLSWAPQPDLPQGEELDEAILERLGHAVRRRMRSDVPIGFFLSGGVDSSLVAALGATISERPIHTFTLVYDPEDGTRAKQEDRRCARLVAERYGTIHVEEEIAPGDLSQDLPKVLAHFDQPFAGVISTFYLARRIARDVKVALAGDGADEAFGSYLTHRLAALLSRPDPDDADVSAHAVYPDLFARSRGLEEWRWRSRVTVFDDEEKAGLLTNEVWAALAGETSRVESYFRDHYACTTAPDPLNRVLEVEFGTLLPDQVLAFVDRLSMAHSLEVRCPFLDQDLLSLVAAIPASEKIGPDGEVKRSLKRAARRYLPEELVRRPKEGFLMPVNPWLRGALEPWVRSVLAPEALKRSRVFRPDAVERLLARFYGGETSAGARVLCLVAYQLFHELYLESAGRGAVEATCPGTAGPRSLA